jgi:hypothetical protein
MGPVHPRSQCLTAARDFHRTWDTVNTIFHTANRPIDFLKSFLFGFFINSVRVRVAVRVRVGVGFGLVTIFRK